MVHLAAAQHGAQPFLLLQPVVVVAASEPLGARGDDHLVARLGVADAEQSHVGQLAQQGVVELYGHDVVLAVGDVERVLVVVGVIEVADEEGRRAPFGDAVEKLDGLSASRRNAN